MRAIHPTGPGPRNCFPKRAFSCFLLALLTSLASEAADLFDEQGIPDIRIEVPEEGVEVLRAYHWQGGGNEDSRTNVLATVREGQTTYTNVALHLKGSAGSFRPFDDRPALTLHFGKSGSPQRFHGLEKLHLNNSVQDGSYLSEIIAREVCLASGLPVPRASHCLVTLNGRRLGLYVLVEGWTKAFLKRHFNNAKGTLYDGGFARDITGPLIVNSSVQMQNSSEIQALLEATRIGDPKARVAQLSALIDIDRFQTLAAMEVLLAHWDGYCINHNNYRIYQNPDSGRLVFLPHGLDQLFGVYRSTPEFTITPRFKGMVALAFFGTREGRAGYMNRLGLLYTNQFQSGKLSQRVDTLAAKLAPVFQSNPRRLLIWSNAVADLKNRIERRVASVGDQLQNPRRPLQIGSTGTVRLKGWTFKTDSSGRATGERSLENGQYLMKIHGGQGRVRTWGSWRHTELLEEGHYELQARVKLAPNPEAEEGPPTDVALRISGDLNRSLGARGTQWQDLSYRFEIGAPTEVELLCELRGTSRTALIDADSLQLVKRPSPAHQE